MVSARTVCSVHAHQLNTTWNICDVTWRATRVQNGVTPSTRTSHRTELRIQTPAYFDAVGD